nr:uncharacterized protein LOC126056252 isoform X1 [Helicoverpa armigera]
MILHTAFLFFDRMRTYKRKTERGTTSQDLLQRAADAVIKDGRKLKTVARELEICHTTLQRYVKKIKSGLTPAVGYKPRLVFNEEQEALLSKYILKSASIYFGLLPEEVRQLAYQCAVKFKVQNIPPSWHKNGEAGKDWLTNFLKRNPTLSIRTPEATSAGRASSFNRHNVNQFFEKLGDLITKHNLTPSRIWNLDETGVQTVLKPKKILAEKGTKQVGAIVSAERGTLVTVELAVSALGNSIPPMFVFPRLKYKELFIRDGPPECIGAGNKSGWMTSTEFLVFMDHFIKHTKPSPEEPVLLLLDNHSSHIDIDVIEKAKRNSVILLSFPPHCTHRLQPLDVGVNGPFKTYCSKAQNNWLRTNPGKIMSIYEIPGIVKYAFPLAATPINICNAFKKTGIWPYDSNVFIDEDYAPSFVTDRPMPENRPLQSTDNLPVPQNNQERTLEYLDESNYVGSNVEIETSPSILQEHPGPSDCSVECTRAPSGNQEQETRQCSPEPIPCCSFQPPQSVDNNTGDKNAAVFSPELIRPLPKAPPRLIGHTKARKRKTAVLTDTPEKNALAEEQASKKKKTKKKVKGKGTGKCKGKGKQTKKPTKNPAKRRVLQDDDSSDDEQEWFCIICCDAYSNSAPGEQWIECRECKNWAHLQCVEDEENQAFVCPNCYSDQSSGE